MVCGPGLMNSKFQAGSAVLGLCQGPVTLLSLVVPSKPARDSDVHQGICLTPFSPHLSFPKSSLYQGFQLRKLFLARRGALLARGDAPFPLPLFLLLEGALLFTTNYQSQRKYARSEKSSPWVCSGVLPSLLALTCLCLWPGTSHAGSM